MIIRKVFILFVLFSLMAINVSALSLNKIRDIFFPPEKIEDNSQKSCLSDCLAQKNECLSRCDYRAICKNNCLSQNTKCKQDCKGIEIFKGKSLKNILGDFLIIS